MLQHSPGPSPVREVMTVLAAIVVGLTAVLHYYAFVGNNWVYDVRNMILGFVLPFSCVIQFSRVRVRRSVRRALCSDAGFTATLAAAATFAAVAVAMARKWDLMTPHRNLYHFVHETLVGLWDSAPLAIAATWLVLALGRRWRLGRSWSDRLCAFLGLFWFSLPVLDLYVLKQ